MLTSSVWPQPAASAAREIKRSQEDRERMFPPGKEVGAFAGDSCGAVRDELADGHLHDLVVEPKRVEQLQSLRHVTEDRVAPVQMILRRLRDEVLRAAGV